VYDAPAVLEALIPGERPHVVFEQFKVTPVAEGAALVTYVSRSAPGDPKPPALRSSLWCVLEGRWQLVFHQGTPLPVDAKP
jgi:hypothetical protein